MSSAGSRFHCGRCLAALGSVATLSCTTPTDPASIRAEIVLLSAPHAAPPIVHDVGPGTISISATIPYPCLPYVLRASGRRDGALLTVRAEGREQDSCLQDVTGVMSYRIQVRDIPAGSYQLLLINEHREWVTAPDTVLVESVEVP